MHTQSLTYQKNNAFKPDPVIYRNHGKSQKALPDHKVIRCAVRAWAADCRSREFVAALIADEWRRTGNDELVIPTEPQRQMQKIFRWLDADTGYAQANVRLLTPAILAVLPLEYRSRLVPQEDMMSRIAAAMKECSEAKQAVLLGAPEHQKLKEVSEGIASLFRLMPEQVGPLMSMVTSMLGAM
ncbi:toxin YdaT domain-containing protein [Citrobacter sp. MNAZ 1397]|uniref:toxin YdaT domain-containing protein n=1 Tax=Citrobacter sp. MNAZ 1397 TaxID=2911205 RepID=UPI00202649C5|nr:toxin YdaT domain-containing protein [Citrobacter sp. MNAZ 1397]MCL9671539.1 toxin YdaT domain-containing protein [Citrobacter sp. MNAZ 1397]